MNLTPDSRTIFNRLKASAKKRNINFTISIVDINDLSFPITCPILGIPLKYHRGKMQDDSYSIDRIDSTLGYEPDNIQVISMKANRAKNNLTEAELRLLANFYK